MILKRHNMELRIKEICREKGTSITGLAEKLGMKQVSLSRIINGNPTVGTLQRIADTLGVSFIELFEVHCPKCGIKIAGTADEAETPAKTRDVKPDTGLGLFEGVLKFADLKRDEGKEFQKYITLHRHLTGYARDIPLHKADKTYLDGFGEYLSRQTGKGGVPLNPINNIRALKTVLYSMQGRNTDAGIKKWL